MIVTERRGDNVELHVRCDAARCEVTHGHTGVAKGTSPDGVAYGMSKRVGSGWSQRMTRNVLKDYCPVHADFGVVPSRSEDYLDFRLESCRCVVERSKRKTASTPNYIEQHAVMKVHGVPESDRKTFADKVANRLARTIDRSYRVYFSSCELEDEDENDATRVRVGICLNYKTRREMPSDHDFVAQIRHVHAGRDAREILRVAVRGELADYYAATRERVERERVVEWAHARLDRLAAEAREKVSFKERLAELHRSYEALRSDYDAAFKSLANTQITSMSYAGGECDAVGKVMTETMNDARYHPPGLTKDS